MTPDHVSLAFFVALLALLLRGGLIAWKGEA